ncbi:uncharacterized protein LOC124168890 isoform X2 [Ischnura elegans]|nr:uncharacterized protein LOC124168890 isoform X2 [Ischnura elegans]
MTTITDTSILNWLPLDETGGEVWRMALVNSESQNWNVSDPSNSTTVLAMTAAARHGNGSSLFTSPAHLGLATGLLLSLLLNSRIWTTKANREVFGTKSIFGTPKPYQWILHLTPSSSFTFASTKTFILPYLYLLPLLAIILLLPIVSILMAFLLPFAIYRFAVKKYLQNKSNYCREKKLFSGADAVWTFNESYESYSVINALVVLEGVPQIDKLRHLLTVRLGSIPKLRMRHNFTLGYATWYEDREMDLGSLVQWIPGFSGNSHCGSRAKELSVKLPGYEHLCNTTWNRKNLSKIVENLCNRPLPMNHTVGWEALVGKEMPWNDSEDDFSTDSAKDKHNQKCTKGERTSQTVFPILFRIHHSVGDGASLLQLLMSALIDRETNNSSPTMHVPHPTSLSRPLTLKINPIEVDKPKLQSYINAKQLWDENATTVKQTDNVDISSGTKTTDFHTQSHTSPPNISETSKPEKESSFLYGRRLSGRKTILWDSTSVTVEEIKKIRGATGVKFTEILLSAVSAALSNYWEAREKGQVKDATNANKKVPQRTEEGQNSEAISSHDTESEDDWDRLTDVPEENEGETICKEQVSPTGCEKQGTPPSSVKLVLPAIIGSIFQKQKDLTLKDTSELENLFSVAVMTLPVGKSGGCPLQRLSKVTDASGYMMPLRKDSIVECGMKTKIIQETFSNKATGNTNEMNICDTTKNQGTKDMSSTTEVIQPKTTSQETAPTPVNIKTKEENVHVSPTTPREPQVLTYYYTKQPEVQFKLTQEPEPATNKSAQVHYHRYTDSAKLILHEKEPYHCPTTIFFTQNTHRSSSTVSEEASHSPVPDETRSKDISDECFDKEHLNALKPKENAIQDNKNEDIDSATSEPITIQDIPKSNAEPKPSINFPSSPTIQHLLTRWLALDIVATVLPSIFAAPMMKVAAKDVAVVMSNLPGPPQKLQSILGGHALKDIVFWAPHRGYTGLGITILSYDGLLHIGVMADDAVIPTQKGAQLIMNSILDELHSLRAAVSSSH